MIVNNDNLATREGAGSCLKCRFILPRLVDCAPAYFENGAVICRECGEQVDLWQATLNNAKGLSELASWALSSLGAAHTSFVLPMETGKYYPLELTNYGVSPGARILMRYFAPQGGEHGMVTALEWHPNNLTQRTRGTLLQLIAVPIMEGTVPRVGPVLINVTWIRSEDSDGWPYLVTAFESAAERDYGPALVFAQSAVEISMMPVIEQRLRRHVAADRVENFMKDSLTYSHALNVVLPYVSAELGAPKMPDEIRGALNKLRKRRNAIIHQGAKTAAISVEDAMEGLCAAAFGFEFMRYIGPILLANQSDKKV